MSGSPEDQQTCINVGRAIRAAQIPPASATPEPGEQAIAVERHLIDVSGALDVYLDDATGELAQSISAVADAVAGMGAEHAEPWGDRRDRLTEAMTDLHETCAALGVPDFLNP